MHFRLIAAGGAVLDEGDGSVSVDGGTVVLSPQLGQPLRIEPAQIAAVKEDPPYTVHIDLSDGSAVDLSQLGELRTQILSQLGEVRVAGARSGLVTIGIGTPMRFRGAVNDADAEITLYDDGVVAIPADGLPVQVPYALVDSVSTDPSGYRISIDSGDAGTVVVQRLAQMTSQFVDELRRRVTEARGRTGAFLASLLPGLGPIAQRQAAASLRDGVGVTRATLDALDATIWPTLVQAATLPDRIAGVPVIEALGETALGFHQRDSVEVGPRGATTFAEAGPPRTGTGPGAGLNPGMQGPAGGMAMMMERQAFGVPSPAGTAGAADAGFGAPFGLMGGMLAMQMLRGGAGGMGMGGMGTGGMGMGGGTSAQYGRPMGTPAARPDDAKGLVAAHDDMAALTTSGESPTILGFVMSRTPNGHIVYETLNEQDHATYVFAAPSMSLRAFNLALLLIGFHIEVLAGDLTGAGAKYGEAIRRLPYLAQLAAAFTTRVIHVDGWEDRLRAAVA